jgi:hypothetical protein
MHSMAYAINACFGSTELSEVLRLKSLATKKLIKISILSEENP